MTENSIVVKSNNLIQARYKLNLNEQKVILYAVSKLDREQSKFNTLELNVKEFTELIGTTSERYSEIRELVRELRRKEVIIKNSIDNKEKELIVGWLSSIEYKGDGKIELEFSQKLIPYLLQLKKRFTKYELKNILYLKNKYSIRIYELLKQYEIIGSREFEIEELKKIIGCEGRYNAFKDFKRCVLDVVVEELNENTDLELFYTKINQGRKVTGIKFIIKSKKSREQEFIEQIYSKKELEEIKDKSGLSNMKVNSKQLIELYEIAVQKTESKNISPYRYISDNYRYIIEKSVKNQFAYLKKALEEDYANSLIQLVLDYSLEKL